MGISEEEEAADLRSIEQTYLVSGGEFLVGLLEGEVIAMGGFQRLSGRTAELRRMRIRTDLQGRGYGSLLLEELERLARRSRIDVFTFETAKARPLTLKFYGKHGYRQTGSGMYGNIETVHFAKTLSGDNPWLSIPVAEYEGHMNDPEVDQLAALNSIFRDTLADLSPASIAVLGCAAGNGFEHISERVGKVVGIDINPDYLALLRERQASRLPNLELACSDIEKLSFPEGSFDLVYGALFFEYVDYERMLPKITGWLAARGALVCVLQLPGTESGMISETKYPSLKTLHSLMRLIEPGMFDAAVLECGLSKENQYEVPLKQGKRFMVVRYVKDSK
jgi:SAM-dependent methyltransferase